MDGIFHLHQSRMSDQTHHSTIEAEVRKIANSCDLGDLNTQFFLKSTFVSNIASFVQRMEAAAFQRGMRAQRDGISPSPLSER